MRALYQTGMNAVGIMQGRLLPSRSGQIQAFPGPRWREEFPLASQAGLDCIEWIYDVNDAEQQEANPLASDGGIDEILRLSRSWGVAVRSICADCFMKKRLIAADGLADLESVERLRWLLGRSAKLGVRYIILPFVDSSSLRSVEECQTLAHLLSELTPAVERGGAELHLETDLPPEQFVSLLSRLSHPLVKANYDIGNSASLGRDPAMELGVLSRWLGSVHVKDRICGGTTVRLGTGDADFPLCFRLIREAGFPGPLILQAAREDSISEVDLAVRNRRFVEQQLSGIGMPLQGAAWS